MKIIIIALGIFIVLIAIFFLGRISVSGTRILRRQPGNLALNEFGPERVSRGFEKQRPEKGFFREIIEGQITKIDENILTLKDSDNTKYTIKISDETSIQKDQEIAKQSDLKVGDKISVLGPSDSKGEIVAKIIEIN